ncbi:glycosyltransferase, partial [Candidatus Pelagibacter sp.]|nr:glycosyltransferase [Candidatus Pelagibacter sp.]
LIENIDLILENSGHDISIFIVNDASTESFQSSKTIYKNLSSIQILNMKKNMGHARCIATGLKYIFENSEFDFVIPMDGDGEDRPEEIKNFIDMAKNNLNKTIVGNRVKRSEGLFFKTSYLIHKIITFIFAGKIIKFGNFTCLPKKTVSKLINDKSSWSSFSGSLTKLEKNLISSPSERGLRFFGPSKMNFLNLLIHSFSIIAVFKTTVILRSILFYAIYLILISNNITFITAIPLALIVIFAITILKISGREDINALNNSLSNVDSVEPIK